MLWVPGRGMQGLSILTDLLWSRMYTLSRQRNKLEKRETLVWITPAHPLRCWLVHTCDGQSGAYYWHWSWHCLLLSVNYNPGVSLKGVWWGAGGQGGHEVAQREGGHCWDGSIQLQRARLLGEPGTGHLRSALRLRGSRGEEAGARQGAQLLCYHHTAQLPRQRQSVCPDVRSAPLDSLFSAVPLAWHICARMFFGEPTFQLVCQNWHATPEASAVLVVVVVPWHVPVRARQES